MMPPDKSIGMASFWHGPSLSAIDIACLLTFVENGFAVTVYSYAPLQNLPEVIRIGDANEIVESRYLSSFIVMGRPSLSHFSDLFRYRLFQRTGEVWIDSDLFCQRPFDIPKSGSFFAKETPDSINGAIMRIDPNDPRLSEVTRLCEGFANGEEFTWGATGPSLVSKVFGDEVVSTANSVDRFYPIHWTEWWRPFSPSDREWCEEHCSNTDALHLWNNIVEKSGYWKDLAPPVGSYLHNRLLKYELLGLFKEVCPESVMVRLIESDVNLRSGGHFRLKQLARMTLARASSIAGTRLRGKQHS